MRILAFTTALMLSGAALAQTTTPPDSMPSTTTGPETPPTGEPSAAPADPGMPATPDSSAPTTQDQMDPGQMPANPDANAPTSQNQMPAPAAAMPAAPAPMAQAEYPRCSRTVVDQCRQSSARESDTKGGPAARHKARRR